ncbi:DNA-binding protein, partial [Nitrosopumilus sp.]|nr:DNA-binding protein [Nitrosopumilus sp.]
MSSNKKSNDAEDILSEFGSRTNSEPEPVAEPTPEPVAEPTPEPVAEPTPKIETTEERNVIFIGTKPIMDYVSATLTQLSTRPTITIKARGKRITQAVDVSQMIAKRMDAVGFVI